jgi:hypothetical protein
MSKWKEHNDSLLQMGLGEILDIALAQFEDLDIAQTMAAVSIPESGGGKAGAIGDGGSSVGLWQINRIHFRDLIDYGIITVPPEVRASLDEGSEENSKALWEEYAHPQLSDPAANAKAAWMIGWEQEPSRGPVGNAAGLEGEFQFSPWSMYSNDSWKTTPADDTQYYLEDSELAELSPYDAVLQTYASRGTTDPLAPLDDLGPGNSEFDPPDFGIRVRQALKDPNTPKAIPLEGGMTAQEYGALQRSTQDPDLKAVLSKHAENFRTGNAGFLGYETDEEAKTAAKWLRIYGIGVDSQFPFIAYSLGKQAIDKTGDIASQLWDRAIGSLWGGGDGIDRSAYLDYGSDEISDDLNPERR